MPDKAKKGVDFSKDDIDSASSIINNFQNWADYFINGDKEQLSKALAMLRIREWLEYEVEYYLPAKLVKVYSNKLDVFLSQWGL